MPKTITPPDHEFAAASGSNVNWSSTQSYFDHPPNSTSNLTITSNAGDDQPFLFETGETYDISWQGHGGGTMEDATIIRSDNMGADQGVVVFEGINSNTGELFQMVWTPNYDLENWYWSNGGGPSSPNAFWTSDQDPANFRYICFAQGTLIATPSGSRRIESLRPGDRIGTLDNGLQIVRWTSHRSQHLARAHPQDRPVRIAQGAFGPGLPNVDLTLSAQHRILLGGRGVLPKLFDQECLAPAKALAGLSGVKQRGGGDWITWHHFACTSHEITEANGLLCETLLLGQQALQAMDTRTKARLRQTFAAPFAMQALGLNGPPARELLSVGETCQRIFGKKPAPTKPRAAVLAGATAI